MYKMAKP